MSPTTSSPRVTSIARYTRGALPRTPLQQQQLSLSPIQGSTRAVSPPDLMCLLTETIISPIRQTPTAAQRTPPLSGITLLQEPRAWAPAAPRILGHHIYPDTPSQQFVTHTQKHTSHTHTECQSLHHTHTLKPTLNDPSYPLTYTLNDSL